MARDPAFTSIETERLVLRRFERDDVEAFAAYRGDPDVARYQSWQDYTHAEAEAFVAEMLGTDPGVPGEWFQFAIAERATARLIGDCALVLDAGDPPTAEIGYTLDPGARGRGFATEAVGALIDYVFDRQGAAGIRAVTDTRNAPSIAVAERLGMRRIATVRTTFKGAACDEHTFELRRDDRG
jgi:RimJ/RimL family protein N-acetyltransferase